MASPLSLIHHGIGLAAAPKTKAEAQAILAAGVTHVLDLRNTYRNGGTDRAYDEGRLEDWMDYLDNGTRDDGETKGARWFARGWDFCQEALSTPGGKLCVQCASCVARAPSMGAFLLMRMGSSPEQALRKVLLARPYALMPYFDDAVAALEKT